MGRAPEVAVVRGRPEPRREAMYTVGRKVFRSLFGRTAGTYLREHSLVDLASALLVRRRWRAYYEQAKRVYAGGTAPNWALADEGVLFVRQAVHVPPGMLAAIHRQLEDGDCVSFVSGNGRDGVQEGCEKVFLKKAAIRELIAGLFMESGCLRIIERHLSCHVRIVNASLYKTFPNIRTDFGGFVWHRDRLTEHSYKILTYLTDVGTGDGPFAYVPGSHRGHTGLPGFGRTEPKDDGVTRFVEYYGAPGDAILFDVNGYHRGGGSVGRERIVVSIHVQPSKIPCRAHNDLHGFGSVGEEEYGRDPDKAWWRVG